MKTGTSTEPRISGQSIADGRIHTLTGDTFSSLVLNGEGPIVVEFMSYGCAYCRALEPALQEAAGIVKSKETILRVNIDPNGAQYGLRHPRGYTPSLRL